MATKYFLSALKDFPDSHTLCQTGI